MKDLNNNKIEEETQNELQDLFNELFVSKLFDELNVIKGKKAEIENSEKIFSDIKKSIDIVGNEVEDRINGFIELISFLGNEYEDIDEEFWEERSLASVLKDFYEIIFKCKMECESQTKILGTEWEKETLHTLLHTIGNDIDNSNQHLEAVKIEIASLKSEKEKILKWKETLVNIDNNLLKIKQEFENEGVLPSIAEKNEKIIKKISECKQEMDNALQKIDSLNEVISSGFLNISGNIEKFENETVEKINSIIENNSNIEKLLAENEGNSRKRDYHLKIIVTLSVLLNLAILILLFIRG